MEVVEGKNTYYVAGDIMLIMLTQGQIATIDTEDYDLVKGYRWYAYKHRNTYYASAWYKGHNTHIKMHRLILDVEVSKEVDHKNMNGLDNCRCNIRACSGYENRCNRKPEIKRKYKGVYFITHPVKRKFRSLIGINGKSIDLGTFFTEEEAAKAYDRAALKYHGEFARTNLPKENYGSY